MNEATDPTTDPGDDAGQGPGPSVQQEPDRDEPVPGPSGLQRERDRDMRDLIRQRIFQLEQRKRHDQQQKELWGKFPYEPPKPTDHDGPATHYSKLNQPTKVYENDDFTATIVRRAMKRSKTFKLQNRQFNLTFQRKTMNQPKLLNCFDILFNIFEYCISSIQKSYPKSFGTR